MMATSPGGSKGGVVGGGGVGDGPLAPGVLVAQIEAELLQLLRGESVVIEKKVIFRWSSRSLENM